MRVDRLSLGALAASYTESGTSAKVVRIEWSAAVTATTPQMGAILSPLPRLSRKTSIVVSSVAFQAFTVSSAAPCPPLPGEIPENKMQRPSRPAFLRTQKVPTRPQPVKG